MTESIDLRKSIVDVDKEYVWHPYTPMKQYIEQTDPLVIARAEGSYFWDVNGSRFIDANSSWWVSTLGHNHPRIVQALKRQADQMCHVSLAGIAHEPSAMLAKELIEVSPKNMKRVFFSDNGSTAIEVALKMALKYWVNQGQSERSRFVALDGAFHGETMGATSIGGIELFHRGFERSVVDCIRISPVAFSMHNVDSLYEQAFGQLSQMIQKNAHHVAAVIIEPIVQGASGMRMYSPELLRYLRSMCDRYGILLIVDEVFTGYGRLGTMWACDQANISPDILCVAKGFTAGVLPMAATITTSHVFDSFYGDPEKALFYGHSYCGNPLGASVAQEVLRVYRDEKIIEQALPKMEKIRFTFSKMKELPNVANSRSLGMIGALDLATNTDYLSNAGWRVYEQAKKRGAYLRPLGDVVYIAPPINIPDETLDDLLGIVEESVRAVVL